ncbi:hypothetical protein E5082_31575 [Streptomyces griseoluteus]|uniref:Uncharacterized protein n=1 Tax=Streptomyces griseoluteus TaxID=29306 RepID=A0A4Z1CWR2_STRGP|nr:hypothetical protein [Streptomyces griseoluteus]TGN73552.1 hypothetical protein E5082_31575 [Streptomyces griseoluteus]
MIDETHVAELLPARDDDAGLILLEGTAQVVDAASLTQEDHAGAAVLLTQAELVDRLGTVSIPPQHLADQRRHSTPPDQHHRLSPPPTPTREVADRRADHTATDPTPGDSKIIYGTVFKGCCTRQ